MALFDKKQKKAETKPKAEKKAVATPAKRLDDTRLENVIKAPWLSEKALIGTGNGVYVFAVSADATKPQVKAAVERIYKVVPTKVNVVTLPGKRKNLRAKRGQATRPARYKAYVYLKKGDTITFA